MYLKKMCTVFILIVNGSFNLNRVVMNCVYYGDFRVKHFNKRRIIGLQKTRALDAMLTQKIDPSVYIRNQARCLMNEGIFIP